MADLDRLGLSSLPPEIVQLTVDALELAKLPSDGLLSRLGDGVTTIVPSPTHFAGEVGMVDLPAPAARGLAVGTPWRAARRKGLPTLR